MHVWPMYVWVVVVLETFIYACKTDNTKSGWQLVLIFAEFSFCFMFCLLLHSVPYIVNDFGFVS